MTESHKQSAHMLEQNTPISVAAQSSHFSALTRVECLADSMRMRLFVLLRARFSRDCSCGENSSAGVHAVCGGVLVRGRVEQQSQGVKLRKGVALCLL
eukprot:CAMPEP_0174700082 /NCGR_PEP_ID=MMETSP1094-20130205/5147_1 /TAXON_ID=156173 /ORGANISM="Chrysochromulina brevifilum, Strain UTEX LB 985" /LENGTH=97 /DNA_ID=CAMNT_0015897509 /DNA_START=608 /DNA_END=899 /DNA_ORIENTATION=+